jgi:hypothetical protein
MQIDGRATTILVLRPANILQNQVSGVGCQDSKKADRLGSYKAGKLEGLKARKLPGFLASGPASLQAMSHELSATSYFS